MFRLPGLIYFILILSELSGTGSGVAGLQNYEFAKSKDLVARFNKQRELKSLAPVKSDTLLDNLAFEILKHNLEFNCRTCKYSEEEIRKLFYEKGVIDYQYEINEFKDADTTSGFYEALIKDRFENLSCGYARIQGWNLILKTKSYLEYGFALVSVHGNKPDKLHEKAAESISFATDSIIYYLKPVRLGKFCFQYANLIPVGTDWILEKEPCFPIEIRSKNGTPGMEKQYSDYNLILRSKQSSMYAVILDESNYIVAILK